MQWYYSHIDGCHYPQFSVCLASNVVIEKRKGQQSQLMVMYTRDFNSTILEIMIIAYFRKWLNLIFLKECIYSHSCLPLLPSSFVSIQRWPTRGGGGGGFSHCFFLFTWGLFHTCLARAFHSNNAKTSLYPGPEKVNSFSSIRINSSTQNRIHTGEPCRTQSGHSDP